MAAFDLVSATKTFFDGCWAYRSFLNTPEFLVFGEGTLLLSSDPVNHQLIKGFIGGDFWQLTVEGEVNDTALHFKGTGLVNNEEWEYEYSGRLAEKWSHAESQQPAILGTVLRVKTHGTSQAGTSASFIAVKAGVRKALHQLSETEKQDLIRAYRAIQQLPPSNPDSFFYLSSIHGAPGDESDSKGRYYCHHKTVLFPSWHRPYMSRFEEALRKHVPEERKQMFHLPYWDQSDETGTRTLKEFFLPSKTILDGVEIDNPLALYVLPVDVRVPLASDIFTNMKQGSLIQRGLDLPEEVYLENMRVLLEKKANPTYANCLHTYEFGRFATIQTTPLSQDAPLTDVLSVEWPHDIIHNSIGGYPEASLDWERLLAGHHLLREWEEIRSVDDLKQTPIWARLLVSPNVLQTALFIVDHWHSFSKTCQLYHWIELNWLSLPLFQTCMANVEVSSYDPIFYFHHCNIDRYYAAWQAIHGLENWSPPTPPPPGYKADGLRNIEDSASLTMDTQLLPFVDNTNKNSPLTVNFHYGYDALPTTTTTTATATSTVVAKSKFLMLPLEESSGKHVAHLWEERDDGLLHIVDSSISFTRFFSGSCPNCLANPLQALFLSLPASVVEHSSSMSTERSRRFIFNLDGGQLKPAAFNL